MNTILAILLITSAFVATSSALELNCIYVIRNNEYQCHAKLIRIPGSSTNEIERVTGSHIDGKTNSDVVWFWIAGDLGLGLTEIPMNIGAFFPNIESFRWSNNHVETLEAEHLKQFPHLTFLGFQGNEIQSLRGDLLRYNPNVTSISIAMNYLKTIEPEILDHPSLQFANFIYNLCIHNAASRIDFPLLRAEISKQCAPPGIITTL